MTKSSDGLKEIRTPVHMIKKRNAENENNEFESENIDLQTYDYVEILPGMHTFKIFNFLVLSV